ncbi:PPC domain-containing protein [Archangium gephyra]|uniref:PPC domain-containing protein n=1 Tax=Archangium gephyra TaxID=48 RepID=UPI0035D509A4
MRRWNPGPKPWLAAMLLLPFAALSQTTLGLRCDTERIPADLAEARLEWMRRCALLTHVGNTSLAANTGMRALDGNPMFDYTEPADYLGTNSYTGTVEGSQVNQSYLSLLYLSGSSHQIPDPNGYLKWTNAAARKKQRPQYPVYGSHYDINSGVKLYPHPTLSTCTLYTDTNGVNAASTFYVSAYCDADPVLPLAPSVAVGSLSDTGGGRKYYSVTVPAGVTSVVFETGGGTGDVDLYVKAGSSPTFTSYGCRPYIGGNTEVCSFSAPTPGTWYVMLHAWSSYSGASLTTRFSY